MKRKKIDKKIEELKRLLREEDEFIISLSYFTRSMTGPFCWHGMWINEKPAETAEGIDKQASAAVRDLLLAAHVELVECRRLGQARPYEGTEEIHSDGEPPIAYVIDRIERMLGRGG